MGWSFIAATAETGGDHAVEGDGVFDRIADYTLYSNQALLETQAVLFDQPEVKTSVGLAQQGNHGAYRVVADGESFFLSMMVSCVCKGASWCTRT